MEKKSSGETLSDLLKQAAEEFDVPIKILSKILAEERYHLYLLQSSRQNVRRRLREIIQEACKDAST